LKVNILKALKLILPLAIGGYLIYYMIGLIRAQDEAAFFAKVKEMNYWWIGGSLVIGFFSHLVRAHRWKYLLEPMGYQSSLSHRYHATMVGYVINMVVPRAGEASRAGVLLKTDGVPFIKSFGTIIAERAVDLILLACVGLITVSLSVDDFYALYNALLADNTKEHSPFFIYIMIGLVTIGLISLFFIWRNASLKKKLLGFIKDIKSGLFSILRSKNPSAFIFHSVFIWVLYVLFFGVCFMALEETQHVPVQGVLMAFVAGTIGVMLTNGGVGVYPLFVGTVISFYAFPEQKGVPHSTALALATMIWLSQTVFLIVLGLISLFYVSRKIPFSHEN